METQTNTESSEKLKTKAIDVRLELPEDVHKAVLRRQATLMLETGTKVTIPDICVEAISQWLGVKKIMP